MTRLMWWLVFGLSVFTIYVVLHNSVCGTGNAVVQIGRTAQHDTPILFYCERGR